MSGTAADVIDASHKVSLNDLKSVQDWLAQGPVMAYMKKVTDAKTDTGIGGGWFKISQAGLNTASKAIA